MQMTLLMLLSLQLLPLQTSARLPSLVLLQPLFGNLFARAWFRLFEFLLEVSVFLLITIFARFSFSFTHRRLGVTGFCLHPSKFRTWP